MKLRFGFILGSLIFLITACGVSNRGDFNQSNQSYSPDNQPPERLVYPTLSVSTQKDTIPVSVSCEPLNLIRGTVIEVKTVEELRQAILEANGKSEQNFTILIEDGMYRLTSALWIDAKNLVVRSASQDRERVILLGGGMSDGSSHIFQVAASDVVIADMTIGEVQNHAVQIHGELGAHGFLFHNVHVINTKEQMIKGSYDSARQNSGSDKGVVECSTFEYTKGIGPQYYIGGIDVHNGRGWIVRNSTFKNFRSPQLQEGLPAEHAIHFWSDSEDTIVENNIIINSDRGIGFGLGERGHQGGIIRNNIIYHDSSEGDVGIGLESASDVLVQDNIIVFENDYPNAIEYRYPKSRNITITGTKTNKNIQGRDGGEAVLIDNDISLTTQDLLDVSRLLER